MNSNDGTTGIQVAPIPTESEMASIRQIFTNVANALVRASELATQVTELEGKFKALSEDHTRVMARSDQLEQSLVEARAQRDEYNAKLGEANAALADKTVAFDNSQRHVDAMQGQIEDYQRQVASLKTQNSQISDDWLHAMDRAEKAEASLAKIKATLGIVDPPPVAAKPEPQPPRAYIDPPQVDAPRPLTEPEVASAPEPQPEPWKSW